MNILITGAAGFIGRTLCKKLASGNNLLGIYYKNRPDFSINITWKQADLNNTSQIVLIFKQHPPDLVIHAGGISHEKYNIKSRDSYLTTNASATKNLAMIACNSNRDVSFIYLSSVAVYGGPPHPENSPPVDEKSPCNPYGPYAKSKFNAEKHLTALYDQNFLKKLVILRLAPVYDYKNNLNLRRRVSAPFNIACVRFGSGRQKLSPLAKSNAADFIAFLISDLDKIKKRYFNIINVCDETPSDFNTIINLFQNSKVLPCGPVIPFPLKFLVFAAVIAGFLFPGKKKYIQSFYSKIALDQIYDNRKMLFTGFKPKDSIETVFRR